MLGKRLKAEGIEPPTLDSMMGAGYEKYEEYNIKEAKMLYEKD